MILIDNRVGSKEFIQFFDPKEARLTHLEFADFAFAGNGLDTFPWQIGLELKTIEDMLSCIGSGRFTGHQLPGLLNSYQCVYLILQGLWRANPNTGVIQKRRGRVWSDIAHGRPISYKALVNFINTLQVKTDIKFYRTISDKETSDLIKSLYSWWSKPYESHTSCLALHKPIPKIQLTEPTLVQIMAFDLPGVGFELSLRVSKYFDNVQQMVNANAKEWQAIEGVGKKKAEMIVKSIIKVK